MFYFAWGVWQVDVAPPEYAEYHPELREEFGNATVWPKHLLVMYSWREVREVDAPMGLALLFAAGEAWQALDRIVA